MREAIDQLLSARLNSDDLERLAEEVIELARLASSLPRGAPERTSEVMRWRLFASALLNALQLKLTENQASKELLERLMEAVKRLEVSE